MTDRKTAAYCVLLAIIIFAGALFISMGEAQARYSNTIFFSTVIEAEKAEISSDVLVKNTEAPVTVLLGEIESAKTFEFSLDSSGGDATEIISWSFPAEIVSVSARLSEKETVSGGETAEAEIKDISSGTEITLSEGTETKVMMTVVPAEGAKGVSEAEIEVLFGGLCGKFSFDLPAAEKENVSGGEAETLETAPGEGVTETESTGEETGETEEETAGETAENIDSPKGSIRVLSHFDPKGKLPVKADIPAGAHYVKIGFYRGEEISPLPAGTRISLDEGNSFYAILESAIPEFGMSRITNSNGKYSILLDFGKAELSAEETVTVAVEAFSESGKIGTYTAQAVPDISGAGRTGIEDGVSELEIGENEEAAAEKEPEYYVLSEGDAIRISFPEEWEAEAASGYSIQILGTTENDTVGYSSVTVFENSLWAEYAGEEGNADLLIKIGDILPPAGKYQAYLRWEFDGICFYRKQITFFINYSTDVYSTFEG